MRFLGITHRFGVDSCFVSRSLAVLSVLAMLLAAAPALASTHTWTGASTEGSLWSDVANWAEGDGVPMAGETDLDLVFPDATMRLANENDIAGLTIRKITFSGSGYSITGVAVSLAQSVTVNDGVMANAFGPNIALTAGATLTVADGATITLGGVVSGSSGITKAGGGTAIFSAVNTYTGTTSVNAGTLQIGVNNAIASGSAVTVASGATLNLNGMNDTIASLAGAGSVTLGGGELTTGSGGGTTFSGVLSGSNGKLTKAGSSTFTLSGANTYTGATTINGGTLFVNGSQPNSNVTVNPNATLGGTGTVKEISVPTMDDAAGTVSPGVSGPGILNAKDNVTFSSAATFPVQLNGVDVGTGYDQLSVTGTGGVTLGLSLLFPTLGFPHPGSDTIFTIVSSSSTAPISGHFRFGPTMLELNDGDTFPLTFGTSTCYYVINYTSTAVTIHREDFGLCFDLP